jgi:uncharacterized protein
MVRCGPRTRQWGLTAVAALLACTPLAGWAQSSAGTSHELSAQAGQERTTSSQTEHTQPKSPQALAGQPQYIAPADLHVKPGGAPAMKVKLIGTVGPAKHYVVIFSKDDEAFSGLTDFALQYHVVDAHFTAIGALEGATLAWFDPQRKAYKLIPVPGQSEVASMVGDIALYHGKPVVHTHAVLGLTDGSARAGHVIEAHVSPTLEVFVTTDATEIYKKLDEATGLTLIDPTARE